jgi:2-C-methyl-D-erythritol 4-phosphate cytidylyltransferase
MPATQHTTRQNRFGLVVAAGLGKRFGSPKQFARIKGRPLLYYALKSFEGCSALRGYVVVTNPDRVVQVRRMLSRWSFGRVLDIVGGGRRRSDSVRLGLEALPDRGLVAIHDGARPLVTPSMIARGFNACTRSTPVTYGTPVTDTLKRAVRSRVVETVDRAGLFAVQTPQYFHIPMLRKAYEAASTRDLDATDDCALVERLGYRARVVPGPPRNIKVTTRDDLKLAEKLL